jgi:hypothetical protein
VKKNVGVHGNKWWSCWDAVSRCGGEVAAQMMGGNPAQTDAASPGPLGPLGSGCWHANRFLEGHATPCATRDGQTHREEGDGLRRRRERSCAIYTLCKRAFIPEPYCHLCGISDSYSL